MAGEVALSPEHDGTRWVDPFDMRAFMSDETLLEIAGGNEAIAAGLGRLRTDLDVYIRRTLKEPNVSDSETIVREFCAAWERRDIDELLGFFTEDAVYHNIPTDPAQGHDAIRAVLMLFVPMSKSIEFRVDNLASAGDVVFTERVDSFGLEKGTISLPVAGVFEIRDGKIAAWRDYFDMQQFMTQFQAAS